MKQLLQKGYNNLNDSEKIQLNKHALAANMNKAFPLVAQ
ncbi:hypothetical protein DOT_1962 [Desulfosporosinus sp. OT]|nr:hypothetical protein DOT_1962 [Desulfosporosinus sp. OT]